MSGFLAMERAALEHPLLQDGDRFRAWFWLLAKACWKGTRFDLHGKTITLERGQLCVSRSQLADAWGWSSSAVERFLVRLETEQMIGRATGQGRTIITVCNYAKYQDVTEAAGQATGQPAGQRPDSDRTAKEPLNHLTKDIPSPKGDGRGEPAPGALDLYKTIFRSGVEILTNAGHDEPSARGILGKWKKNYSDGTVLAVLARCQAAMPEAPVEWLTKALAAEQLRAAGQTAYHQGPAPNDRQSVSEVGADIAAERAARRLREQEQQQRIAIGGR